MNILISLVCASIVSHADDLDKVVSAEVRAASAPVAIAELSRQVGFPLEAMQSTKNDILVIKVDKVPLGQLMKKIGETINAGWEKTDRGYRLLRTAVMEREEEAAQQKALAAQIEESLKKMRAKLEKDGEFTPQNAQRIADRWMAISRRTGNGPISMDNWREEQALRNSSPSNRLIARMSANLNAEMLASIPRNRRLVFSTQPNRMQRPMPVNLQPYIGTFLKEQTNWAKAMKFARSRSADPNYFYYEGINDPTGKKPGKILLSVARQSQGGAITLRIIIADTKGQPLGSASENLGLDGFQYNDQMSAAQKAGESEESMKFTGASKELMEAASRMYITGQGRPQLSPETRALLLNPEKVEPLSTIATDAILEMSRIKKLNVVACPTDMMTMGGGVFGIKEPKPASFLAMTFPYQVNVAIDDGWMILKPSDPGYTRDTRSDRAALGAYLRTGVKEGRLSLENRANYAYHAGEEDQGYMAMFSLSMLGLMDQNSSYGGDWEALKLYGSLSPTQRAAAKNSTPIPFRQLRPEQTEILRHMIFDYPYSRLSVNWDQQDIAEASNGEENQILGGGLEQEATELLPTGFTGQEILTITDSSEPRFFGSPDNEGIQGIIWGEQAFDENSLAFELFQQEKPEFFPWRNQPGMDRKPPSKYRMGTERRVAFNSKLTRRATLDMQVTDKSYTSEAMALDKLPGDVKKRVDEALARYREQYKNMKPSDFNAPRRGNIIPPPRR